MKFSMNHHHHHLSSSSSSTHTSSHTHSHPRSHSRTRSHTPRTRPPRWPSHTLLCLLAAATAHARHNVTIDDNDVSIVYAGMWSSSVSTPLDFGGTHMLTQDPGASATLVFNGTSIYFLSPLWPYPVNTLLTLDNNQPVIVDLVDHSRPTSDGGPETVPSGIVWSAMGLQNGQHRLVVSVGPSSFGVVDGMMFTVLDEGDPGFIPSSSSSTLSSSSTPTSLSSLSSSIPQTTSTRPLPSPSATLIPSPVSGTTSTHVLPIALGTILGILGLLLVAASFWFCMHKRRRVKSEAWTDPAGGLSPQTSLYRAGVVSGGAAGGRESWTWRERFSGARSPVGSVRSGEMGAGAAGMAGVGSAAGRGRKSFTRSVLSGPPPGAFPTPTGGGGGFGGGGGGFVPPPQGGGKEFGYGEYNPYQHPPGAYPDSYSQTPSVFSPQHSNYPSPPSSYPNSLQGIGIGSSYPNSPAAAQGRGKNRAVQPQQVLSTLSTITESSTPKSKGRGTPGGDDGAAPAPGPSASGVAGVSGQGGDEQAIPPIPAGSLSGRPSQPNDGSTFSGNGRQGHGQGQELGPDSWAAQYAAQRRGLGPPPGFGSQMGSGSGRS